GRGVRGARRPRAPGSPAGCASVAGGGGPRLQAGGPAPPATETEPAGDPGARGPRAPRTLPLLRRAWPSSAEHVHTRLGGHRRQQVERAAQLEVDVLQLVLLDDPQHVADPRDLLRVVGLLVLDALARPPADAADDGQNRPPVGG